MKRQLSKPAKSFLTGLTLVLGLAFMTFVLTRASQPMFFRIALVVLLGIALFTTMRRITLRTKKH